MQNQEGLQETGAGALTPAVKSSWAEIIGNQLCGKTIFNNCSWSAAEGSHCLEELPTRKNKDTKQNAVISNILKLSMPK